MEERRERRHRESRRDERHREEKSSHRSSSRSRDDSGRHHHRRDSGEKRKRDSALENSESKRRRDTEIKRPFDPPPTPPAVPNGHFPGQAVAEDALAKARKLLELKKSLAEKIKKVNPQLDKIKQAPAPPAAAPAPAKDAEKNVPAASYEALSRVHDCVTRMGFHQPPGAIPLIPPSGVPAGPKSVKPPPLLVDALGREVDEHGAVVDQRKSANVSTLKVNINKQKKDAFQILHPELDDDPVNHPHFDGGLAIDKTKLVRPKRSAFQFVEQGRFIKQAEIIRLNNQYGEAKAREIRAKQAMLNKAKAEGDINPNLIEVSERVSKDDKHKDLVPDVEFWDAVLLPTGKYSDINQGFKKDKINIYVEHPVPIEPPAEPAAPPPQPLKLTKKEQKKMRTQRRVAREKERQELIRQGKIEPPKSKVKMSNLMKVLSSEATQDPTKMEQEIRTAAAERERAHIDRNLARKLTPAERREKKDKKLFDDTSTPETIVSVYRVGNISHPQTRFKVDVNAQENRLTGCALVTDGMTLIVAEGGSKAMKRYDKLMTRRIDWTAKEENAAASAAGDEEEKENKCIRVWQGSVARPAFHQFTIQKFHTAAAARKYLADVEVAHYWDSALAAAS